MYQSKLRGDLMKTPTSFKIFFGFVITFIALVFCLVIGSWIFIGVQVNKLDMSKGIKPVIEQFWCGTPGCMKE